MVAKLITERFLGTTIFKVQFVVDGRERSVHLGMNVPASLAVAAKEHVDHLLEARGGSLPVRPETAEWVSSQPRRSRSTLRRCGLVKAPDQPSEYPRPTGDDVVPPRHRIKACAVCGEQFIGPASATACSQACRVERLRQRSRALVARRSKWRVQDNSAMRCKECRKPMTGARSSKTYCSPACRQKAYRERK